MSIEPFLLAGRLHSGSIRLLRQLRRRDAESGITAPHLSALSVLVFAGERTLGELADAEGVRPPSITRIVRNLERDGLLRRQVDAADRRVVRVSATDAGRRLLEEGRARRVAELAGRIEQLADAERIALEDGLRVLDQILAIGR